MNTKDPLRILVTGATGSFGKAFVKRLLSEFPSSTILAFSRDELKQFEMRAEFSSDRLSFMLGDVRDFNRVCQATAGIDIVIHAAAMKQIPAAEQNPMEAIKTNILGAENIVNASLLSNVNRVIALSTDKAANPANLYGATKLCSDKLMIAGNYLSTNKGTKFSVVRYGNVLGSRGSVIPFFHEMKTTGSIPITDPRMTRFWLTLDRGVDLVLTGLSNMQGGEIFVPKIPSFKVTDVAQVVAPECATHIIGIRPGEKLHEVMITEDDSLYTVEFDDYYAILSPQLLDTRRDLLVGNLVPEGFSYRSDSNTWWHTDETFKAVLREINLY
jgi:UDP-N-acetylglucosamine 4,6-dehydratase/5-epimerase